MRGASAEDGTNVSGVQLSDLFAHQTRHVSTTSKWWGRARESGVGAGAYLTDAPSRVRADRD